MYINQKLRLKWNGIYSDYFSVMNGVKQGGVISPCLFCVYIDQLLMLLKENGVGCFIGSKFMGAIAYADDLILLSPSAFALKDMVKICCDFASKFDIQFNCAKSQLIGFTCSSNDVLDPCVELNGQKIAMVDEVTHLGHRLSKKIYDFNVHANKCVADFNRQCNIFLANFKYANSYIKNTLFHKYCSSFYGSQLCPLFGSSFDKMCTQWRIAIRRVWKIPWQTHCRLLPHIAGVLPPELWFAKRLVSFVLNGLNSSNTLVAYMFGMSHFGLHSIMGCNIRLLQHQFGMNCSQVMHTWSQTCCDDIDNVRVAEQIKELVYTRDRCSYGAGGLNREECNMFINFLCTN